MLSSRRNSFITFDEWRELNRNSHDKKYEYIDGQVYLMSGGTANHARIASNAIRAIEDALGDDSPCNVYNSDLSVRITETRYTLPDVSVTCDERDLGEIDIVQSPRLIIEVLSDSTEAYDRGKKFAFYRQCLTLEEYVLVSTDHQAVEVFHCTAEGWMEYHARVYHPGDIVVFESLGIRIPFSTFYRRTTVKELVDDSNMLPKSEK